MITLTEKEKEILLETISFYNSENRGYDKLSGHCVYEGLDGNRCAVGRCMTDEGIKFAKKFPVDGASDVIVINYKVNINSLLQEKYQGASLNFWKRLQSLHDISACWDASGINDYGKENVKNYFGVTL
jgi:hypothetical protein